MLASFNGQPVRSLASLYGAWRRATAANVTFLEFGFSAGVERKIILDQVGARLSSPRGAVEDAHEDAHAPTLHHILPPPPSPHAAPHTLLPSPSPPPLARTRPRSPRARPSCSRSTASPRAPPRASSRPLAAQPSPTVRTSSSPLPPPARRGRGWWATRALARTIQGREASRARRSRPPPSLPRFAYQLPRPPPPPPRARNSSAWSPQRVRTGLRRAGRVSSGAIAAGQPHVLTRLGRIWRASAASHEGGVGGGSATRCDVSSRHAYRLQHSEPPEPHRYVVSRAPLLH